MKCLLNFEYDRNKFSYFITLRFRMREENVIFIIKTSNALLEYNLKSFSALNTLIWKWIMMRELCIRAKIIYYFSTSTFHIVLHVYVLLTLNYFGSIIFWNLKLCFMPDINQLLRQKVLIVFLIGCFIGRRWCL